MFYSIHIIPKLNSENDPAVVSVVDLVKAAATCLNVAIVDRNDIQGHTLIVAVGGDGTMLEAMRMAARYDATALGVNLGRVGFLSDINVKTATGNRVNPQQITGLIKRALLDDATVTEHRSTLMTSLDNGILSCNEVSIAAKLSDTMVTYHLRIGEVSAGIHRANSILISTATGSTAYSLSAGGALMMPHIEAIQIVPVAPITMTSRPLIVGANSVIGLEIIGNGITVRGDGQVLDSIDHLATKQSPYRLQVRQYIRKAKVLHFDEWNFFDVLTEKLGWQKE